MSSGADSSEEQTANGYASQANHSPYTVRRNDNGADDVEEKTKLISQVLELQNTLDDLSRRVDSVKEESLKLRSENQVLGQYIQNLMVASDVFQATQQHS